MPLFEGGCHCGAIRVAFESARTAPELDVRACACAFCRTHGARTMTDPSGHVRISAQGDALSRYRFGLRTADFLTCRRCGAYVGAFFEDGGAGYATLNVNALAARAEFSGEATPTDYGAEDADGRTARRRRRWTPAVLIEREPEA